MDLYNDDCFNVFPKLKDKSIDLFVLDLPYGQTACKWDSCIDLTKMWVQIKRIMKPNAVILFYCTTKFGYKIIQSNEKWFRYDLIWKKSRKVGFLSANKMPLRQHENIYVFKEKGGTYNPQKTEADKVRDWSKTKQTNNGSYYRKEGETYKSDFKKDSDDGTRHPTSIIEHENIYVFGGLNEDNDKLINYSKQILKFIGKTKAEIKRNIKDADHFFRYSKDNFSMPTEETYNKLIVFYKIDKMEGFIDYKDLDVKTKYNPQKTKGKPYKSKERIECKGVYIKDSYKRTKTKDTTNRHPSSIIEHENVYVFKEKGGTYNPQKTKGKEYNKYRPTQNITTIDGAYGKIFKENKEQKVNDRHPTSIYPDTIETTILEHNNPAKSLHRTQKPTSLCEWLIKTYSNEGDTVMDFTMGSGTTGEACKATKRKFIGVEMDKDIFKVAKDRLDKL